MLQRTVSNAPKHAHYDFDVEVNVNNGDVYSIGYKITSSVTTPSLMEIEVSYNIFSVDPVVLGTSIFDSNTGYTEFKVEDGVSHKSSLTRDLLKIEDKISKSQERFQYRLETAYKNNDFDYTNADADVDFTIRFSVEMIYACQVAKDLCDHIYEMNNQ